MAKVSEVILSISSERPTHGEAFADKALDALYQCDAMFWPQKVGLDDNDLRKFKGPCGRSNFKKLWAQGTNTAPDRIPQSPIDGVFWKRGSSVRCSGKFGQTWRSAKGSIIPADVHLSVPLNARLDFLGLFRRWCDLYEPKMGYVHFFVAGDREYRHPDPEQERAWSCFRLGVFGPAWNQKMQNLGAITFIPDGIGADLTGDQLRKLEIGTTVCRGGRILSLVDELKDLKVSFDEFSAKRAALKSLLPPKTFVIEQEPYG